MEAEKTGSTARVAERKISGYEEQKASRLSGPGEKKCVPVEASEAPRRASNVQFAENGNRGLRLIMEAGIIPTAWIAAKKMRGYAEQKATRLLGLGKKECVLAGSSDIFHILHKQYA